MKQSHTNSTFNTATEEAVETVLKRYWFSRTSPVLWAGNYCTIAGNHCTIACATVFVNAEINDHGKINQRTRNNEEWKDMPPP